MIEGVDGNDAEVLTERMHVLGEDVGMAVAAVQEDERLSGPVLDDAVSPTLAMDNARLAAKQ
ncbi:hypothetical protein GCM10010199_19220 [Dactylosporangium roseum]